VRAHPVAHRRVLTVEQVPEGGHVDDRWPVVVDRGVGLGRRLGGGAVTGSAMPSDPTSSVVSRASG
jgi:hypothetical protein